MKKVLIQKYFYIRFSFTLCELIFLIFWHLWSIDVYLSTHCLYIFRHISLWLEKILKCNNTIISKYLASKSCVPKFLGWQGPLYIWNSSLLNWSYVMTPFLAFSKFLLIFNLFYQQFQKDNNTYKLLGNYVLSLFSTLLWTRFVFCGYSELVNFSYRKRVITNVMFNISK